ncbi:MAG: phosphatase PAP2 family protein [Chitinophagaceae bacterium]|nr:phosphatase PAP2 family protein [Chitinophagaceae bacterium]
MSHASIAQNADINIAKAINQNETAFKNSYAKFCSKTTTSFSFASPLTILSVGLITKNKALQKDAIYIAGSYVASTIVTQAAKHIIQRERPYQKYNFITQRTNADANTSMPSGHTSAAFCMATSLSLRYKKWYIIVPAYLYAGSVAWARMYQGVHYPSDVFIGALIGAGSAWAGLKIQQLINKKHRK